MVARAHAVSDGVGPGSGRHMSIVLERPLGLVAAAVRHAGWWLDWQTRVRAGQGSRLAA